MYWPKNEEDERVCARTCVRECVQERERRCRWAISSWEGTMILLKVGEKMRWAEKNEIKT